ncbi:MAG TPA: response regulator transcription factor [Chloroflexota bacterium]
MAESRVLVVEDDQILRTVIADALLEDGYTVETAADGQAALESARRSPPDLVILDLMMPYMDGEVFSAAMRGIDGLASTPIILISASRHAEDIGARIGAHIIMRKPFDLFELTEQVNTLLR